MVEPRLLCRQHLLGEHRELHALVGIINRGTSLEGYVQNGLVATADIEDRHRQVAQEMAARGFNHQSPLILKTAGVGVVDTQQNIDELRRRCVACKERIDNEAERR